MSKYILPNTDQKYELRNYKIFFNIQDSIHAEELLNVLDRATPRLVNVFCQSKDPSLDVYIYPDLPSLEKVMGRPLGPTESMRALYADNSFLLATPKLPKTLGEDIVQDLGYMIFHHEIKERDVAMHTLRTPSWLREGVCTQVPVKLRSDSTKYLLAGWTMIQDAEKNDKLIKPSVMVKNIGLIPDPARRQLALYQSYYMVKLLLNLYCDKFVHRYGTLMSALEDMEAEDGFRQVTSFDFEKFFSLFREWVRTTNGLVAMSD